MFIRSIITTLILTLISFTISAQNAIYITLDVSPSMFYKKYELANYGGQMLVALNQEREVTFIINSKLIKVKGDFSEIQKDAAKFGGFSSSEIFDIEALVATANKNTSNQDVFIIGDGYWLADQHVPEIYEGFSDIVNTGNFKVYYLEVLNSRFEKPAFGKYLRENNIGEIHLVTSTEEIIAAINSIAENITGVSPIPLSKITEDGNCYTFKSELALKKMKLLYQAKSKLANLPDITSIKVNGKSISLSTIATPSNEGFLKSSDGLMSARIFEAIGDIPKDGNVEICFNKPITLENLKIYPISEVETGNFTLSIPKGKVTQIDANTIGVCRENDNVEITFDFKQKNEILDEGIIETATVNVVVDKEKYAAYFEDGRFTTTIPLTDKETITYTVEAELEGYFHYTSKPQKIKKTNDCKPPSGGRKRMGTINFGSILLSNLMREGQLKGIIVDEVTGASLGPENFDIKVFNDYPVLFKSIKLEFIEGDTILFLIEPRGQWCDCFIPDQLTLNFQASPKEGYLIDGKQYESMDYKLIIDIIKEESWMARCKWLLFAMFGSLGFAWFMILLSRKRRFGRGCKVIFRYPNMAKRHSFTPEYTTTDFVLRKKGFGAWLNRWFNPFTPEKNTLSFHNINLSILFTATKSIRQVVYPRVSFDEKTMDSINYDPDSNDPYIVMDESSELQVNHVRGLLGKTSNYLEYSYPKRAWDDITTFRIFLGILIGISITFFFITLILLIRSLF